MHDTYEQILPTGDVCVVTSRLINVRHQNLCRCLLGHWFFPQKETVQLAAGVFFSTPTLMQNMRVNQHFEFLSSKFRVKTWTKIYETHDPKTSETNISEQKIEQKIREIHDPKPLKPTFQRKKWNKNSVKTHH